MSGTNRDVQGYPGADGTYHDAHKPCQGQLGMSKVILGQMGHLVPLNHNAHRPCQGQPGMPKVVLGQMRHLVPGKTITRN